MITFRIVDSSEVGHAYEWHREFAGMDDALYPRSKGQFYEMVFAGQVWCGVSADDKILGLSYAVYDEDQENWEIGGLMVAEEARDKGLGEILMRLPLIHMLVTERPTRCDPVPPIVTHVIQGNEGPRKIIPRCGFVFSHPLEIPKDRLPGLRHDENGMVRGDEFHLQLPDALHENADWLDRWRGTLRDDTPAAVDLLDRLTLADWSRALRSMAD